MKRLAAIATILALSTTLLFAHGGGGSGGGSSGGSAGSSGGGSSGGSAAGNSTGTTSSMGTGSQSGAGTSATPGAITNGPNNAGGPVPSLSTPSPSDTTTSGRDPGVNPANPQDASRRGNPWDRSLTGARNPQDMKAFDNGTPQIIVPEKH
jgi:hypothetical protein